MPLYEYLCEACGRKSEVLQRFEDPPLAACPHCGGAVRKLFSAPSFQFKGSGWYLTDYARKGASDGEGAAPPSSTSTSSDSSSKSAESASPKPGDGAAATATAKEPKPTPSSGGETST